MKLSQIRSRNIALFMLVASIIIYVIDYFIVGNIRDIYLAFLAISPFSHLRAVRHPDDRESSQGAGT
ncbi:hypothetical protein [Geotalea toluenoxydans]|uniref:hypothetical protein n=1 Tax=Geotalea toluenoxydans TaxID=421624 RepID=UPI000A4706D4|nr:hypothetical protein [Geotalea toluenoxydans]